MKMICNILYIIMYVCHFQESNTVQQVHLIFITFSDEIFSKHSWFPPMVWGTNEVSTSLDVWNTIALTNRCNFKLNKFVLGVDARQTVDCWAVLALLLVSDYDCSYLASYLPIFSEYLCNILSRGFYYNLGILRLAVSMPYFSVTQG